MQSTFLAPVPSPWRSAARGREDVSVEVGEHVRDIKELTGEKRPSVTHDSSSVVQWFVSSSGSYTSCSSISLNQECPSYFSQWTVTPYASSPLIILLSSSCNSAVNRYSILDSLDLESSLGHIWLVVVLRLLLYILLMFFIILFDGLTLSRSVVLDRSSSCVIRGTVSTLHR